jgi:hypothetical protein
MLASVWQHHYGAQMNITLKQIKPDLHIKLKKQAERNKRSLSMEAVRLIEQGIEPDLDQIFAEIRKTNSKQTRAVSAEEIRAAIREARR